MCLSENKVPHSQRSVDVGWCWFDSWCYTPDNFQYWLCITPLIKPNHINGVIHIQSKTPDKLPMDPMDSHGSRLRWPWSDTGLQGSRTLRAAAQFWHSASREKPRGWWCWLVVAGFYAILILWEWFSSKWIHTTTTCAWKTQEQLWTST